MKSKSYFISVILLLFVNLFVSSCKKFLSVDLPKTQIEKNVVFDNDVTATSAMLGIYVNLQVDNSFASGDIYSILALCGLSAGELFHPSEQDLSTMEFQINNINPNNLYNKSLWASLYSIIYQANAIIEGVSNSSGLTSATHNQLLGEAYFIRAFSNFYLVNLYGDVPLVLTTNYTVNATMGRTPVLDVYNQITEDLQQSSLLLPNEYVASEGERIRPNKFSAIALLARVYLYQNKWADAEEQATLVIDASDLYNMPAVEEVFKRDSKEAIWQLRPNVNGESGYTEEAYWFSPSRVENYNVLDSALARSFQDGDLRKMHWIDSLETIYGKIFFPRKYIQDGFDNTLTEYSMVIRLSEMFLIRAEARIRLGNLMGANSAASDINEILSRAGLPNTTSSTENELINDIMQERRKEFLAEWGHRWFDLKRWGKTDEILAPVKGSSWQSTDQLYPIPQVEIDSNPNLEPQNLGY